MKRFERLMPARVPVLAPEQDRFGIPGRGAEQFRQQCFHLLEFVGQIALPAPAHVVQFGPKRFDPAIQRRTGFPRRSLLLLQILGAAPPEEVALHLPVFDGPAEEKRPQTAVENGGENNDQRQAHEDDGHEPERGKRTVQQFARA